MANHSRGVSLRNRGAGLGFWRDEAQADGGKRRLRRRARRLMKLEARKLSLEVE